MRRFLLGLLIFALVAGLAVLALTPVVAEQYRKWHDAQKISEYLDAADAMDTLTYGTLLAQARRYNDALKSDGTGDPPDAEAPDIADTGFMDLNGDGVMAVLVIPKLGETLPVYRGASEETLDVGVGHQEGSSLPVGGTGTMCVLTGRRGGRKARPFDDLDRLIPGDCFYLHTLQDTLVYEVDQSLALEPDATGPLEAASDEDVCALTTAASPQDGTKKLLVRAKRTRMRAVPLEDNTRVLPGWAARTILAMPVAICGLAVLLLAEGVRRAARRRRLKRIRL